MIDALDVKTGGKLELKTITPLAEAVSRFGVSLKSRLSGKGAAELGWSRLSSLA
jgi:hypothetical protein